MNRDSVLSDNHVARWKQGWGYLIVTIRRTSFIYGHRAV